MFHNKKISVTLGGSVDQSFGKSATQVISGLDRIAKKEKQLKDSHALIGKLKADQLAIGKTSQRLKEQSQKLKDLQRQYSQTEKPSVTLRNKISKLQKQVNSNNIELRQKRDNLKQVGQQLKRAGVDTANLTSEEKRLQRAIEHTQKQAQFKRKALGALGRTLKTTKYAVLGLVGGMSAYGVAGYKMANDFADHGDQIAKTADKLGISTTKLQELHYAAERSGVSVQTMNMAMQRMVRRTAEAAKGTGEAKAAIQELGLSAIELKELKPDQALGLIADRLELVTNKQDKLRIAQKLFDSSSSR